MCIRDSNKRTGENYNLTAGLVHDISDKTSVNLSGMIRSFNNTVDALNTYEERLYSTPSVFSNLTRERNSLGDSKNFATQIDFGLDQKIGNNGQLLNLSGSFQTNKSDGNNQIVQNTYVENILQPSGNSVNNAVSYTHLDVYKRQGQSQRIQRCAYSPGFIQTFTRKLAL